MIERCSDVAFLSSLRILVEMLFGPVYLLALKFEIASIISSFVQDEMKIRSWLGGDRYWKSVLHEIVTSDWSTEQKRLLQVFAIVHGSVTVDLQG